MWKINKKAHHLVRLYETLCHSSQGNWRQYYLCARLKRKPFEKWLHHTDGRRFRDQEAKYLICATRNEVLEFAISKSDNLFWIGWAVTEKLWNQYWLVNAICNQLEVVDVVSSEHVKTFMNYLFVNLQVPSFNSCHCSEENNLRRFT